MTSGQFDDQATDFLNGSVDELLHIGRRLFFDRVGLRARDSHHGLDEHDQ